MRVLDLSLNLPGPYATWLLACQGADVVKLEPPRGDPARFQRRFFDQVNRGKRSVVLDLRDPSTHVSMRQLIDWADVLVEGFRPGVMERLGFGPSEVHASNPRLVYCRISAYGQTGPLRHAPAHDLNLQASTGFTVLEGDDDEPRALRLPLADLSTSLAAVAAIHRALGGPREREVLDVAMADTLRDWSRLWETIDLGGAARTATRRVPRALRPAVRRPLDRLAAHLQREKLFAMPNYGLYPVADGWLAVGIVDEQHFWEAFAEAIGLSTNERRLGMAGRIALGPLLRRRIASRLRRRTVQGWLARLEPLGLPVTAVVPPEALPTELQARPPLPGSTRPPGRAPDLGEHTDAVLSGLG